MFVLLRVEGEVNSPNACFSHGTGIFLCATSLAIQSLSATFGPGRFSPSHPTLFFMSQREHEKRLDYVEFRTTDIGATQAFYGKVFGWKFEDYGPAYTSFYDGRLYGGFWLVDEVIPSSPLIVIYAWDLPSVMDEIKEAGGSIVKEIFSFPGGERFHFKDPSGNELAVWSDANES